MARFTSSVLALALVALLVGQAVAEGGNSRTSNYKGAAGSGAGFKAAKLGLLDQWAKENKTSYKTSNEKLTSDSYSVTYTFPTAKELEAFQAWQYKQASFTKSLEKFSTKAKGNSNTGRKLL